MFEISIINPLTQFGKRSGTLLFHDTDGVYPDGRWDKKYPENVTLNQIKQDIRQTLLNFAEEVGIPLTQASLDNVEFSIDRVGGTKTRSNL
jgi:hypothetical protein